jgi:adenylate cyclase
LAWAYYTARRYDEASDWARKAILRRPRIPEYHLLLAASLGQLGNVEDAKAELDAAENLQPDFAKPGSSVYRYKNAADNEHLLDGLRKAGLPD